MLDPQKRTVEMVLEDGTRHVADADGDVPGGQVRSPGLSVDPETVFPRERAARSGDPEMTIAELRARAAELEGMGQSSHNQIMAIHRKFSIPVACLVFGVIGLALGATNRRDGKLGSFVLRPRRHLRVLHPALPRSGAGQGTSAPAVARGLAAEHRPRRRGRGAVLLAVARRRPGVPPRRAAVAAAEEAGDDRQVLRTCRGGRTGAHGLHEPPAETGILDRYVATVYARVFALCALGLLGAVLHLHLHRPLRQGVQGGGDVGDAGRILLCTRRRSTSTTSCRCRCCSRRSSRLAC